MKTYSAAGYLVIFVYLLACMYFAPTRWGPWAGLLIGGVYLIFCWFMGGLYLADVLHLGIAHRSLDYKEWFIKAVTVVNNVFAIYVDPIAWVNRHRLHHKNADHFGDPHDLLMRYWRQRKWLIRRGIEHVAYHFDTPEATAFMKRVVEERVKDGEDRYWPVNYLAKKCDKHALKELSTGRYRNRGSLQYESSVELFGKCSYRPAIPYLVDTAVYDWSFNIAIAADHSLHALYPDGPKDFDKLEEMQKYFCRRARGEGFKVRCNAE